MKKTLAGKTVLLTGAAGGIGSALAKRLLIQQKAALILVDRDGDRLRALQLALDAPDRVQTREVDLTSRVAIEALCTELADQPVDVLINNAGIALIEPFETLDLAHFEDTLDLNLMAAVRLTKGLLPKLIERRGCVVNVASGAGLVAIGLANAYSTSKFALVGFSQALRSEMHGRVSVNVVCPAFVKTDILANSAAGFEEEGLLNRHVQHLVQRLGIEPERLAKLLVEVIHNDPGVVPIGALTHVAYFLRRFLPGVADHLGAASTRRYVNAGRRRS